MQNLDLQDPPTISLPDPSLFDRFAMHGDHVSSFYLDLENFVHNIPLPSWLSRLFPLRPVYLHDLHHTIREEVRQNLGFPKLSSISKIRPSQATLPMGFKWSVCIAQPLTASCLQQAFQIFREPRLFPSGCADISLLQKGTVPFTITQYEPCFLHIIDDVTFIAVDWRREQIQSLHRILRNILRSMRLPIKESKSCYSLHVETESVTFIGCHWNLRTGIIFIDPTKYSAMRSDINNFLICKSIQSYDRILGRIVWSCVLNRPLLSILNASFRFQQAFWDNSAITISTQARRDFWLLNNLLQNAAVNFSTPFYPHLVAFDASNHAGAAVYPTPSPHVLAALWRPRSYTRIPNDIVNENEHKWGSSSTLPTPSWRDSQWSLCFIYKWKQISHINILEAMAAKMAITWAIQNGARHCWVVLLTDSLVVKGALEKGTSSSIPILMQCRKIAALALHYKLRLSLIHVSFNDNPADGPSRIYSS